MTQTRSEVNVWDDISWLQGAAGDGGFVRSEMVRPAELERGNLVRHTLRQACVDGSHDVIGGWWIVERVDNRVGSFGDVTTVGLHNVEHSTNDAPVFMCGEGVEVRTDTRVVLS